MSLREKDEERTEYLADKTVQLIRLFEAGEYQEYAIRLELAQAKEDVDDTLVCAEKMLESAAQVGDYGSVRLYEHMSFRKVSNEFKAEMREKVIELFRDEEGFGYMKGNKKWEQIVNGDHEKL